MIQCKQPQTLWLLALFFLRFKHQVTIALSESKTRNPCWFHMGHQDRSKSRNCETRRYPTVQSRPTGSCCSHWCRHLGLVGGPGHPTKNSRLGAPTCAHIRKKSSWPKERLKHQTTGYLATRNGDFTTRMHKNVMVSAHGQNWVKVS